MASTSHRRNHWNGISRDRGRTAEQPNRKTVGSTVLMQIQQSIEDQPIESVPPISIVAQSLDQLADRIDWEMEVQNLCPLEDEHESNIFDISAIDPKKLQSFTNSNVHDIFIKSIPTIEDCELRFRRALRHHAFKFNLGNITWAKVMSQAKSKTPP